MGLMVREIILTAIIAATTAQGIALAEVEEAKVKADQVMGQVAFINRQSIGIETSRSREKSLEMLFSVNDQTALEHLATLEEIRPGDTVRVYYEQKYREDGEGNRVVLGTVAKRISFIRHAPEELSSKEEPSS